MRETAIKLVVCDLDGTLFGKEEALPDYAMGFCGGLAQKGITFTVATGRSPYLANHWIERLGIEAPYLACNGALVAQKGLPLLGHSFSAAPMKAVLKHADSLGMSVILCREGEEDAAMRRTPWILKKNREMDIYHRIFFPGDDQWEHMTFHKIIVIDKNEEVDRVYREFKKYPFVETVYYGKGGLELLPKGCNKGAGVRQLASILGVSMEDTLAIGNDANDLEMLAACGIGAAVANAYDCAKAHADYISSHNLAEGVQEVLQRFCQ